VPFLRYSASKWRDLETGGSGRSRSLKMAPFDRSRGVGRGGGRGSCPPLNGGSPKKFWHNNGSVQMPPGLPEFIMGSYYYQRCCNLLQMHRPTQRGRCWSQELRQKNQLNSTGTEITPDGAIVRAGHRVGYTYTWY